MGNAESFRLLGVSGSPPSSSDANAVVLVNYEFVRDIQRQIEYSTRNPTAYLITTLVQAPLSRGGEREGSRDSLIVSSVRGRGGFGDRSTSSSSSSSSSVGPLIAGTLPVLEEEEVINRLIDGNVFSSVCLVVYGQGCSDSRVIRKYKQLVEFGFTNVKMYMGGIFEWLLLQECFGEEFFQTTGPRRIQDILT